MLDAKADRGGVGDQVAEVQPIAAQMLLLVPSLRWRAVRRQGKRGASKIPAAEEIVLGAGAIERGAVTLVYIDALIALQETRPLGVPPDMVSTVPT